MNAMKIFLWSVFIVEIQFFVLDNSYSLDLDLDASQRAKILSAERKGLMESQRDKGQKAWNMNDPGKIITVDKYGNATIGTIVKDGCNVDVAANAGERSTVVMKGVTIINKCSK